MTRKPSFALFATMASIAAVAFAAATVSRGHTMFGPTATAFRRSMNGMATLFEHFTASLAIAMAMAMFFLAVDLFDRKPNGFLNRIPLCKRLYDWCEANPVKLERFLMMGVPYFGAVLIAVDWESQQAIARAGAWSGAWAMLDWTQLAADLAGAALHVLLVHTMLQRWGAQAAPAPARMRP